MQCSACGFHNPEGMRFCGQCGTALDAQAPAARASSPGVPETERRHLTVLFCDLVDSTGLAGALDPEELREILERYHQVAEEAVRRYGGYVAQYQGDGIVVYFGYPRAQEGDPRRAVHAALDVVSGVRTLGEGLIEERGIPLSVRVGVEAGFVVTGGVGVGDRREPTALGPALNTAARLQGEAEPESVIVGPAAHRLTRGFFTYEALEPVSLRGMPEPIAAFRALGATGARSRFEVELTRGLTPLVGREADLDRLRSRFERVREREGGPVLIEGEAGIGKSRMLQTFRQETSDAEWFVTRCSPLYTRSALNPIIDMLRRVFRLDDEGAKGLPVDRLVRGLEDLPLPVGETVPLMAGFLSVPLEGRFAPLTLSPEKQRERTSDLLITMLRRRAERTAVVFAVEDLHWADPSTLEFLDRVVLDCAADRILSLLTHRPGYQHGWQDRADVVEIKLDRLSGGEVEALVQGLTGGRTLPPAVVEEIARRTEGVPLFVEELTKTLLESGALRVQNGGYEVQGSLDSLSIPDTLQDSLMARLDRLDEAKMVAQVGSVVGREFSGSLIRRLLPADGEQVDAQLERLVDAELLHRVGDQAETTYLFSHALIQDAAYESLLRKTRRTLHGQVADVLQEWKDEGVDVSPEVLAHHFSEAQRAEEAVRYWQMAGDRAIQRSALTEAGAHLAEGLALLESFGEGPERLQAELGLRTSIGTALMRTSGYASRDVHTTFARASEICDELGQAVDLPVLLGLWAYSCNTARYEDALAVGARVMDMARSRSDFDVMEAHYELGQVLAMLGRLDEAEAHFRDAIALDSPDRERPESYVTGTDPGVSNRAWLAQVSWTLGRPDEARRHAEEMLELARSQDHPYSLGFGLVLATWTHYLCGDVDTVASLAGEAVAMSQEQGFPYIGLLNGQLLHWAGLQAADAAGDAAAIDEALAGMKGCHEMMFAIGARFAETQILSASIEAHLSHGLLEETRALLAQAFTGVEETGERQFHAELLRLRAAVTLAEADTPETRGAAEADLAAALEVARGQGARSFELRAAMDLADLWHRQDRAEDALTLLTTALEALQGGRDSADQRRAVSLLRTFSP